MRLGSHEPNVCVRIDAVDRAGHLRVRVELTADHLAQGHWFESEADQSHLPGVLAACDGLLARLPVRDPAERGV